jgi:hypothetical protein
MNDLSVRPTDLEKDFDVINEWSEGVETILMKEILPKTGCMVEMKGEPVGCAFLYLALDCPVSVMEWMYIKPDLKGIDKYVIIDHIVECLVQTAIAVGKPVMFTGTTSRGIGKILESNGYIKNLTGASHYIKPCGAELLGGM